MFGMKCSWYIELMDVAPFLFHTGIRETYNASKGASTRKLMLWHLLGQCPLPQWWLNFLRARVLYSSQHLSLQSHSLDTQRQVEFY